MSVSARCARPTASVPDPASLSAGVSAAGPPDFPATAFLATTCLATACPGARRVRTSVTTRTPMHRASLWTPRRPLWRRVGLTETK